MVKIKAKKMTTVKLDEQGYGMVQRVVMRHPQLNVLSKVIYALLCSYGGSRHADREAWPSIKSIADDLGLSEPSVIKYLKELEELGVISKVRLDDGNPFNRSNKYIILYVGKQSETSPDETSNINDVKSRTLTKASQYIEDNNTRENRTSSLRSESFNKGEKGATKDSLREVLNSTKLPTKSRLLQVNTVFNSKEKTEELLTMLYDKYPEWKRKDLRAHFETLFLYLMNTKKEYKDQWTFMDSVMKTKYDYEAVKELVPLHEPQQETEDFIKDVVSHYNNLMEIRKK